MARRLNRRRIIAGSERLIEIIETLTAALVDAEIALELGSREEDPELLAAAMENAQAEVEAATREAWRVDGAIRYLRLLARGEDAPE